MSTAGVGGAGVAARAGAGGGGAGTATASVAPVGETALAGLTTSGLTAGEGGAAGATGTGGAAGGGGNSATATGLVPLGGIVAAVSDRRVPPSELGATAALVPLGGIEAAISERRVPPSELGIIPLCGTDAAANGGAAAGAAGLVLVEAVFPPGLDGGGGFAAETATGAATAGFPSPATLVGTVAEAAEGGVASGSGAATEGGIGGADLACAITPGLNGAGSAVPSAG